MSPELPSSGHQAIRNTLLFEGVEASPCHVRGLQEAIDKIDETDSHPNSVFTRKLVDALVSPGITHTSLAKQVQAQVSRLAASANMKQQPAYYDQIIGEVPMNQLER